MTAYHRHENLQDIIGGNDMFDKKVYQRKQTLVKEAKCSPGYTRRDNLCSKQVIKNKTFVSSGTKMLYNIFCEVNCMSYHLTTVKLRTQIYFMESVKCRI